MSARARPAGRGAPIPAGVGATIEVTITSLGGRGDGIAQYNGRPLFVPLALPGERLRVRLAGRRGEGFRAEPVAWLDRVERGPERCPHFGRCGGCVLQHLSDEAYLAWLRAQLADALDRRGLPASRVERPQALPPASRRRARFSYVRRGGGIALGFRTRASHAVVDLAECAVLLPKIVALLPALRDLLAGLPMAGCAGEVLVTATSAGPDVLLIAETAPGLADREALAAFATAQDIARIAWAAKPGASPEPIVQRRSPLVEFGGLRVLPPPGAFLQASLPAEIAIRTAVLEALGNARRIADLFCGCGTFALPLALAGCRVHALDGDLAMLAALTDASRAAGLSERIAAAVRDLERAPAQCDRARRARRRDPRSTARRGASPGRRPGGVGGAAHRDGVLPPAQPRPRPAHPGGRRLPPALGAADRCLYLVRPDRGGRRASARMSRTAGASSGKP